MGFRLVKLYYFLTMTQKQYIQRVQGQPCRHYHYNSTANTQSRFHLAGEFVYTIDLTWTFVNHAVCMNTLQICTHTTRTRVLVCTQVCVRAWVVIIRTAFVLFVMRHVLNVNLCYHILKINSDSSRPERFKLMLNC